jgi:hypothetical protein
VNVVHISYMHATHFSFICMDSPCGQRCCIRTSDSVQSLSAQNSLCGNVCARLLTLCLRVVCMLVPLTSCNLPSGEAVRDSRIVSTRPVFCVDSYLYMNTLIRRHIINYARYHAFAGPDFPVSSQQGQMRPAVTAGRKEQKEQDGHGRERGRGGEEPNSVEEPSDSLFSFPTSSQDEDEEEDEDSEEDEDADDFDDESMHESSEEEEFAEEELASAWDGHVSTAEHRGDSCLFECAGAQEGAGQRPHALVDLLLCSSARSNHVRVLDTRGFEFPTCHSSALHLASSLYQRIPNLSVLYVEPPPRRAALARSAPSPFGASSFPTEPFLQCLPDLKLLTTAVLSRCVVSDALLEALPVGSLQHLQRLSLNGCRPLSGAGLPRLLVAAPSLTHLGIVCPNLRRRHLPVLAKHMTSSPTPPPLTPHRPPPTTDATGTLLRITERQNEGLPRRMLACSALLPQYELMSNPSLPARPANARSRVDSLAVPVPLTVSCGHCGVVIW